MAKLVIDTCAVGQSWVKDILTEISSCDNVIFVESTDWKSSKEKAKLTALQKFFAEVVRKHGRHRLQYAPKSDVEAHMKKVESCEEWGACEACDDPHIFAIVRVKSVPFILTDEKRMDTCRKRMHGHLHQKYLSFRLINSKRNFDAHKAALMDP